MTHKIRKVWVDLDECIGHWVCRVAPDVFKDTGDIAPHVPHDAPTRFDRDRDKIILACMGCPVAAIRVEFADGKQITADDYSEAHGEQKWIDY